MPTLISTGSCRWRAAWRRPATTPPRRSSRSRVSWIRTGKVLLQHSTSAPPSSPCRLSSTRRLNRWDQRRQRDKTANQLCFRGERNPLNLPAGVRPSRDLLLTRPACHMKTGHFYSLIILNRSNRSSADSWKADMATDGLVWFLLGPWLQIQVFIRVSRRWKRLDGGWGRNRKLNMSGSDEGESNEDTTRTVSVMEHLFGTTYSSHNKGKQSWKNSKIWIIGCWFVWFMSEFNNSVRHQTVFVFM